MPTEHRPLQETNHISRCKMMLLQLKVTPPTPTHPPTGGCCLIRARTVRAPCILLGIVYYPDPDRLIFFHRIGFFMVVVAT